MKIEVIYFSKRAENTDFEVGTPKFFHFFSSNDSPFLKSKGCLDLDEMVALSSIKIGWAETEQTEKININ